MMAALGARAWHVLTQLVRGRNTPTQREELFPLAMEQQQWAVGRVLIERGVSVELRLSALPIFMANHQWILSARATEHDVTDTVIHDVMQQALEHGEGSLVAHCIGSLKEPLSVIERQTIFQQALSKGLWWAVKRLVEEGDPEGKAERDVAMTTAAECRQWSVVTHCQQHGADIDKRDEAGETLLHEWGRHGDWEGVERLLYLGADQNIPDKEGYTLLQRITMKEKRPEGRFGQDFIKTMIEFHGDVNRLDPEGNSPWGRLVSAGRVDLVDTALLWSQVDAGRTDSDGNTALHVVCDCIRPKHWEAIRSLVARGIDPLTPNDKGETILSLAVSGKYTKQARRLVWECIQLGVGIFQPSLTDGCKRKYENLLERTPYGVEKYEMASPFQTAASLGDMPLMDALYEAGACSNAELHRFSAALTERKFSRFSKIQKKAKELSDYVETLARNPRSLMSACRLAICHQLGVRRDRERIVRQLDRLDDRERHQQLDTHMVLYLLFSDLEEKLFDSST
ncbi:ankyrin repeat domain-containing protein 50-like [Littorina saxatilis]|uniref:ankyrin repeat domain-containing protein 50-like n=1 Tax=Littorina saxatilis TaxID=31220 RepID=UPI0038B430A6